MANVKISDLTSAAAATGTQQFEVNDGGVSKKVTGAQILSYVEGEISSSPVLTGQVSLDDGTASAPSLTNTGDTNTGVFFPAADTVSVATGGTERVTIDSSGNVGIGTSSPGGRLDTSGADDTTVLFRNTTAIIRVRPYVTSYATSQISALNAAASAYTPLAVGGSITTLETGGVERMRIGASGQLGIGGANYGTSGQVLTSGGASAAPSWSTISSSGLLIRAPQILTSGTSYTTPSNCNAIYVECLGGGGGGGGTSNTAGGAAAGGGGAGGYCAKYFSVSPSTAYTYAIGSAGAGGVNGNASSGGSTTFTVGATTITAGGGGGGRGGSSDNSGGGSGGTATNGDLNVPGAIGGFGVFVSAQSYSSGGLGANSMFGSGGDGAAATGYGAGGGSQGTTSAQNTTGYAGSAGLIRIWEYT